MSRINLIMAGLMIGIAIDNALEREALGVAISLVLGAFNIWVGWPVHIEGKDNG